MLLLSHPLEVLDLDGVPVVADRLARWPVERPRPLGTEEAAGLPECEPLERVGQPYVHEREGEPLACWWPVAEAEYRYLIETAAPYSCLQKVAADEAAVVEDSGPGHLYVLACPAYGRDVWKIGRTGDAPERRARDLAAATGVLGGFLVIESWLVSDMVEAERRVHRRLAHCRLQRRREFFQASYGVVRDTVERVVRLGGLASLAASAAC